MWALRDESLDARGLAASLDEIGQQLASCSPTPDRRRHPHRPASRAPSRVAVENNLLRIGQEALTNAVQARRRRPTSRSSCATSASAFRLRVRDDGRGFDAGGAGAAGPLRPRGDARARRGDRRAPRGAQRARPRAPRCRSRCPCRRSAAVGRGAGDDARAHPRARGRRPSRGAGGARRHHRHAGRTCSVVGRGRERRGGPGRLRRAAARRHAHGPAPAGRQRHRRGRAAARPVARARASSCSRATRARRRSTRRSRPAPGRTSARAPPAPSCCRPSAPCTPGQRYISAGDRPAAGRPRRATTSLSAREREVLQHMFEGRSNKEIARRARHLRAHREHPREEHPRQARGRAAARRRSPSPCARGSSTSTDGGPAGIVGSRRVTAVPELN